VIGLKRDIMQMYNMNIFKTTLMALPLIMLAMPAQADEFNKDGIRGETYCFPAKHAAKTIKAMSSIKAERKDIVAVSMMPRFLIYDDGQLPNRYYMVDGDAAIDFTIQPDGLVPDFISKVKTASKQADLCINDPARAGIANDDERLYFEMGLTPFYKNTSGRHDIDELAEGTKDGKSQYKKMIPAAVRLFMPDTRCLHVKYDAADTTPQIFAEVDGALVPVETEAYNEGYVLHFDDLKDMNAQALVIQGGAYRLSPVPDVKTMKRFGIGLPRGPEAPKTN
jgi:hypothetical protein